MDQQEHQTSDAPADKSHRIYTAIRQIDSDLRAGRINRQQARQSLRDFDNRVRLQHADLSNWPIASFGRRFGAYLIDVGIILGGVLLISAIAVTGPTVLGQALALAWPPLYRPVSAFLFGRTLGKRILGLCLVTDDNVPVEAGSGKTLVREIMWTIFAVIPICNLVWAAMMLADSKKQGWHDKIAGTVVMQKPI